MPLRLALMLATSMALAAPSMAADGNAGNYLAARTAMIDNDFRAAADYHTRALVRDARNPQLLETAVTAYIALGNLERATPIARRLLETGTSSQIGAMALFGDAVSRGAWDAILADLDAGQTVGPLFDSLLRAWSLVGAGRMSDALAAFDTIIGNDGVTAFGMYHKALALGSVGDFEGAAEIFSGDAGATLRLTRRGVIAFAQVLSQLERNADALELVSSSFGTNLDPIMETMVADLEAGKVLPFDTVTSASDGVAEVFHSIAGALLGEAQDAFTLLYSRMAVVLRPDHIDALLTTAQVLEELGQYELATEVYDTVPRDNPAFYSAELGRADALRRSGREDASVEVLNQLTKTHGDLSAVHITLGDTLRGLERYAEAVPAYDRALDLIGEPDEQHWVVFFARGISHERVGQWPEAEADFRKALELRPEQPQVLNYLGYSFLELQINLEEALDLIERAVALRPDSGHIIDSLGWGLYRLGRYREAVEHMERAVELMPVDPIVNDHLGDVYWAVGRYREAEFQWHRALSFINDDTDSGDIDPDRVRRKLEVGLDQVLEEEGAPPLKLANDDN